jgi:hypothetical protein
MLEHKKPIIAMCIELAGTLPAGILAYRLLHWTKGGNAGIERDGYKWASLPNATWCADTGLTPKQLRSAFERLIAKGLIVRKHYPLEHRSLIRIVPLAEMAATEKDGEGAPVAASIDAN